MIEISHKFKLPISHFNRCWVICIQIYCIMAEEENAIVSIDDVIKEEEDSTAIILGGLERSFLEKCTYSEVHFYFTLSLFI